MAVKKISIAMAAIALCVASCKEADAGRIQSGATSKDTLTNLNHKKLNSYISLFEIPATDISRAVNFYEAILDLKIEIIEMPDMQMGVFPYENQVVSAVITKAEGYTPSADGVTIYMNGGENLQPILDKVKANGGKIVVPKTQHADENGYFAIFIDTEGNKIGLHSPA